MKKLSYIILITLLSVILLIPPAIQAVGVTPCSSIWKVALKGTFPGGDGNLTLTRGTLDGLIRAVEEGCDVKVHIKFRASADAIGQGAPPNLSFQCHAVEMDQNDDGASLSCFSSVRYSQYGAVDNVMILDRLILNNWSGPTNVAIFRYTDNDTIGVHEPFTTTYGIGTLQVFTKR